MEQLLEPSQKDPNWAKAQGYRQSLKDLRIPNMKAEALSSAPRAKRWAHREDRKRLCQEQPSLPGHACSAAPGGGS